MDRLDYVSMMSNEHAYCLAIERLLGIDVPIRAQYIRVMFDEITRLLNHLLWLGAHALDCGAMNVFLYAFREREDLFDMYEAVSGARMHAAYYRPGGVYRDLPDTMPQYKASRIHNAKAIARMNENRQGSLLDFIEDFCRNASRATSTSTRRCSPTTASGSSAPWASASSRPSARRTSASPARCCAAPASSGTCARSSPTRSTTKMDFDIPSASTATATTATSCACRRCAQANRIIQQCIEWLRANPGPVITDNHKVAPPTRVEMKTNMEELIHHFKLFTEGIHVPEGEAYAAVEHPKGEFGIYIDQRRRQQAVPPEDPRARLLRTWPRWTRCRAAT